MRWTKIGEIIKAYDNFAKRTISKDGLKKKFCRAEDDGFFFVWKKIMGEDSERYRGCIASPPK